MRTANILAMGLAIVVSGAVGGQVQAGQNTRYIGVDLVGADIDVEFGGFNTAGSFPNNDSQSDRIAGVALTFGYRDAWMWNGRSFTPEAEFIWFQDYDVVSASFPGLPSPSFFYSSNIQTGRLGFNIWTMAATGENWRTEVGLGLGAVYRDVTTSDSVVSGSGSDLAAYGQIGARYLRDIGQSGGLSVALNYVATGSTSVDLFNGVGSPSGNLDTSTKGFELRLGYQIVLGK